MQKTLAAIVAALLIGWVVTMASMAWSQYSSASDHARLLREKAAVATAKERIDEYGDDLGKVASDLADRQDFLEAAIAALPNSETAPDTDNDTVSDSSYEAAKTVSKISASIPEAADLARVEARQLALAERLTRYADQRARRAANAIRTLGLDPKAMLDHPDNSAMGGPLEKLSSGSGKRMDPRFERLGLSMARMVALERGLESIPQIIPANVQMVTSSYGYRRDPFTGMAAMHSGLDFKGPIGAPIYAAATGTISFVGSKSGYGNVVEIDHGNGLMTRYAHMSRFSAILGQEIEAGEIIGAIGNSGRSTGPHLHFEVRINDRAVNPRPFLEKSPDVFKEARTGPKRAPRRQAER